MSRSSIFTALEPATQSARGRTTTRGGNGGGRRCKHGKIRRFCKKRHPRGSRSRTN